MTNGINGMSIGRIVMEHVVQTCIGFDNRFTYLISVLVHSVGGNECASILVAPHQYLQYTSFAMCCHSA